MKSISQVTSQDIDQIYDICVKAELKAKRSDNQDGFLLTAYSLHPETKDYLRKQIGQSSYFISYKEGGKLLGFVLAYKGQRWRELTPTWGDPVGGNIRWFSRTLAKIGIADISPVLKSEDFAVLEKIAVDPVARGRGIASVLCRELFEELRADKHTYVFVEIIKNVYDCGRSLRINNRKSMEVFSRVGAVVVGTSKKPYRFSMSILGERASFSDWVCAIAL